MRTELATERLRLLALTVEQLQMYLESPEELERDLGVSVSRDNVTEIVRRAIGLKIDKMAEVDIAVHPWYTYWLAIVTTEPYGAGLIGFKGKPDEQGAVEIGYGIDPAFRRQGLTTEAVRALIAWAFQHPACGSVFAPIKKTNIGSNCVAKKAGMQVFEENDDTFFWRIDCGRTPAPSARPGVPGPA